MRIVAWLATASIFLPVMLASMASTASQMPLGIAFKHKITIQETWDKDVPFLCVSNGTQQNQVLRVARWQSRQLPALELLRWKLPASKPRCFDASNLRSEWLLEFTLVDGQRLGWLKAPRRLPIEDHNPAAYTSYLGANGSCPTPGTWTEQADLWFPAGGSGRITLNTIPGADGVLMEFTVGTKVPLPHLQLTSASSDSLTVHQADGQITVGTDSRPVNPTVHQAQIEFDVPQVAQPTMFLLSGRKRIAKEGWQCFTRGVLVKPVRKK